MKKNIKKITSDDARPSLSTKNSPPKSGGKSNAFDF